MHRHQFPCLVFCRNFFRRVCRRNKKFHLLAKQINALHHLRRSAGNRCDRAVTHSLMNAVYPFFLGKLFAGEELFKQGLIGFGNCLRERLDQTVYTVAELFRYFRCRHGDFLRLAVCIIAVCFHLDQIDVGIHLAVHDDRDNDRADRRTKRGFQIGQYIIKIGVFIVQFCDHEHSRLSGCGTIRFLRADTDARLAGNGNHHAVRCGNALDHAAGKIEHSRRIQQVHFQSVQLNAARGSADRGMPFDFLRLIVRDCSSCGNASHSFGAAALVEQSLHQCGFSGSGMAGECNVLDCHGDFAPIFIFSISSAKLSAVQQVA